VPLYEYECARCGRFEIIRKFSDPPVVTCPTCGGEVQKMASAPAIQFKGTGWYVTDYARKSGSGKEGSETSGAKDGGASSKDASSSSKDSGTKAASGDSSTSKGGSGSGSSGSSGSSSGSSGSGGSTT